MIEIVNCPFCGGIATVGGLVPWVECQSCGASGPQKTTEAEAITAWNTRRGAGDADRSAELTTAWMAGAERERERAARDAEDAARYRWLRDKGDAAYIEWGGEHASSAHGNELDSAIDAARAGERG